MTLFTETKVKEKNLTLVQNITWIGLAANLILAAFKFIVGFIGQSQTVIADSVHSLSDTITDVILLFSVRYWTAPPDGNHPYGHQKIETITTLTLGTILAAVAISIGYDAISNIQKTPKINPGTIAILGPAVSLVIKEILFQWNIKIGKKADSSAVIANAWHHRSDTLSSLVALISITIASLFPKLSFVDSIGALIVAAFILKIAFDIISNTIQELTDASTSEYIYKAIEELTLNIEGVKDVHAIRTRKTGGNSTLTDLHVLVDGEMTVKKAHRISEKVEKEIREQINEIVDVVVHIEPYD